MKTRQLLIVVMFLFASAVPVWADDQAAYVSSLRNRAVQGDAKAQVDLGILYYIGARGVLQDYAEAFKWYHLAAAQGDAKAQFELGIFYDTGKGVPQDYLEAHKWFNLAAAQGDAVARIERDRVAAKMTPTQIAEAQKLAREWKKQ